MKTEHLKLPWKISSCGDRVWYIESKDDFITALHVFPDCDDDPEVIKDNAEFIIMECNAHDDLVKSRDDLLSALTGLVYHSDKCRGHRDCGESVAPLFTAARAAIEEAEP